MSTQYQTITGEYGYSVEIYDGCSAELQRGPRRWRAIWDTTVWRGNTGGFATQVRYMTAAEGRALLRQLRMAKIRQLRGEDDIGSNAVELLAGDLT